MKSEFINKAWELIFQELAGIIPQHEFVEYSAHKTQGDQVTETIFRLFEAEKLSRIVLEQYTIRSKMYGIVLNIYSKPGYGIPILTFQLGGQIPDKTIFVLDIIPICNKEKVNQLVSGLYQQESLKFENLGSGQKWLHEITSPNLIVCQYKACDPQKIIDALGGYLRYWRDKFYKPACNLNEAVLTDQAVESLLHYKQVLHANDSGLDIYLRNFGAAMVNVIEQAAFGGEPALVDVGISGSPGPIEAKGSVIEPAELRWTPEATQYLQEAPRFVRSAIKEKAELKAKELGLKEITAELVGSLRK